MTLSSAFHGTTSSISPRNTSRLVFFLLPACSASATLIRLIALAPLQGSILHARNVLLIRPSLERHRSAIYAAGGFPNAFLNMVMKADGDSYPKP